LSLSVPDASRVQDQVTLAETISLTRSHPDYYKLQLGNHVLSGAFYASRLYRDLREKAGLVYTVESFIEAGKTRSLFGVVYACDPPNVSKARAMVERDLREMQTAPVTQEELQQAKILLLHQIPLSEASTDGIAGGLLSRSLDDLPLDEPVRAAERYLETTAEQVRDAFVTWIRPADFVQVTVGPDPE
jgi:zinc protease